jgi:hypothetical protein
MILEYLTVVFVFLNLLAFIAFFIDDTFADIVDQFLRLNAAALGAYLIYFLNKKKTNRRMKREQQLSITTWKQSQQGGGPYTTPV